MLKMMGILLTIFISIIMGISSTHWLMMWVMLEINLLCMCFLISSDKKMGKKQESSTFLYYLVQVLGSLMIIIFSNLESSMNYLTQVVLFMGIMMKMGNWPFHLWYLKMIQTMHMSDKTFLILLTIQKILPIVLLSFLNINLLLLFTIIIFMTLLTSIINLKKTSSMKSILGLSSLNNNSWFMVSFFLSMKIFFLFLLFYSLSLMVSLKYLMKMKNYKIKMLMSFWLIILLVSNMGGIPPFSLFWMKSIILKFMINFNISFDFILFMITSTCLFLYYYLTASHISLMKSPCKSQMIVMKKIKLMTLLWMIFIPSLITMVLFIIS